MRVILALASSLALTSAAAAQTAPDRYGPARAPATAPAPVRLASAEPSAIYGGRMLSWASKAEAATPVSAPIVAKPISTPQPASEPAPPHHMSRAYSLGAIEPTPPTVPAPVAPQPPTSLYSPPPVAAAPRAPAQPAPAAPPMRVAAAPTAPPLPPMPMPMPAAGGGAPTRLYSLHREYGMAPDPTPPQPTGARYILIGPADGATAPPDTNAAEAADGQSRPF